MGDELGVNRETIRQILVEDLGKRKVTSRFVPMYCLMIKDTSVFSTQKTIIKTARRNKHFLNLIVAADETWCLRYDPTTKRQSAEWKSPASPKGKKVRLQKSKVKTMLVCFYDDKEIIHHEFALRDRDKLSLEIFECSGTPMEEDSPCLAQVFSTRQLVSFS